MRADLSPAQQAVQGMHAALLYAAEHDVTVAYGSIVFLTVPDEKALAFQAEKLSWRGIKVSGFCEPDLDGALTAIAAGPDVARRLSHLPLALRGGEIHV